MAEPVWRSAPWAEGTDPDEGWVAPADLDDAWLMASDTTGLDDAVILEPLEAQFEQTRSRERVRDLAEVFTHQREIDAMLGMLTDAFDALDVTFLEPACGSGNFLVEILRRKLQLVRKADCVSQEQYEHRLLRALASIYGIDISQENVTEARARMAHVVLDHYQTDANTVQPTSAFVNAAALIIGSNVVRGDTLAEADRIELCEWRPHPGGCFQRIWSQALVPPAERNLFWAERIQDAEPVHYSRLVEETGRPAKKAAR
jgi:SAM-dependent methyltransferase